MLGERLLELPTCFSDTSINSLAFGDVPMLLAGIEALVGEPEADVEAAMKREHCAAVDSDAEWMTSNYDITTTSRQEFWFVVDPFDRQTDEAKHFFRGVWPAEGERIQRAEVEERTKDPSRSSQCRQPVELSSFDGERRAKDAQLYVLGIAKLSNAECVGLRLYSGPAFEK